MKSVATAIIVAVVALWFCADLMNAKAEAGSLPAKIVVGTMRVPPFVLRSDDGNWSGLSVELWNQIAADLDIKFEFREYDYDLVGLLDAVERSQIDAAIAAIPITYENEARFDFTAAYFPASLGIATRRAGHFGRLLQPSGACGNRWVGRASCHHWCADLVAGTATEGSLRRAPARRHR